MKPNHALFLLITALCLCAAPGLYADGIPAAGASANPPPTTGSTDSGIPISQEFTADTSYAGKAETKQGSANIGGIDNINSHLDYVISPQISDGILLRFGLDTERDSFGLPSQVALPNTLQSVNAILGADFAVNDKILLRAELHPGIFSDFVNVSGSDFDMPVQIGGTYLWNQNFQIILGVQIDLKSNYPVIGLPGFRWEFANKWVLSAIPPKPQLQYEVNNALTLYAGGEILGGTYHLNSAFGTDHGNPNLNGNIVDYTEFRVGAGLTWKFTPNLSLDVSGGYEPYREFDIHPDHFGYDTHGTEFHNNISNGAPYAEIGISGSF
jgi:opacity protein-like surface antigen